ncbi:MAG: ATP-binding protein [Pacificimonas sp.]
MATNVDKLARTPPGGGAQGGQVRRRLSRLAGRVEQYPRLEIAMGLLSLAGMLVAWLLLTGQLETQQLGAPWRTALFVAVLLPLMGVLILVARRLAVLYLERRRKLQGARLHVRLVGLFAGLAAVPTLLVVTSASLLFQAGTEFWFSDRAQTVLENAEEVAEAYVEENRERIIGDIVAMGGDLYSYANDYGVDDRLFFEGISWQLAARNLTEAIVFRVDPDNGTVDIIGSSGVDGSLGEEAVIRERIDAADLARAQDGEAAIIEGRDDRIEAIVSLSPVSELFLYASRTVDPSAVQAADRATNARSEYQQLLANSEDIQWRFNLLLGGVALLLLVISILSALWLANRLTAPIGRLAAAAERVGSGDLAARVPVRGSPDELGLLARTFNRMARELESQTDALVAANASAEERRQFIETVLEGVSAGVISVDRIGLIELVSTSAEALLDCTETEWLRRPLGEVVPEFEPLLSQARGGIAAQKEVRLQRGEDVQTLLVRAGPVPGGVGGYVLTFDDVSARLADQRRAAWADVARRIAHEIKNPLTPIQLSAERLQRRYGAKIEEDAETFSKLTSTIVRQVGDLRRMVDEFSSFARMPKPRFEPEPLVELAKQQIFLQEVGNAEIDYTLTAPDTFEPIVCDRRQIAQALTNLLKNAAEAIESSNKIDEGEGKISLEISEERDWVQVTVCDNGPGMPAQLKTRATEPYVTTRDKGTGLGLAIVSKIVEEHEGRMTFEDLPEGGTCVRMSFDRVRLESHLSEGRHIDADHKRAKETA